MKKDEVCALIRQVAIVPAIRVSSGTDAHFAAETVTRGGIPIVEISMAVAGAVELIAAKQGIAVLPGAMTPTEIVAAWDAGADFVKVFPCAQIGGAPYIKALHASVPQIPLIAAGGIDQYTAASYILSGATAIGVGAELIPTEAIERRQAERILELARRFKKLVKDAREQIEAWKQSVTIKKYTEAEKCEK